MRRLACLILGVWIGGILLMGVVATQNLASVDHVLEFHPGSGVVDGVKKLGGQNPARMFLRHLASEQNRALFEYWEWAQVVISISLLLLIVFGTREGGLTMIVALVPVVLIFVQHIAAAPAMVGLGRELDFMTVENSDVRRQFQTWHGVYTAIEFIKILICAGLVLLMMRSRTPLRRRAGDSDDSGRNRRRDLGEDAART